MPRTDKAHPSLLSALLGWFMRSRPMTQEMASGMLADPRGAISFGNKIIFVGIGSFLIWAAFAPLDEGVPSTGFIVVESHRKVVSHLTGGTIADIRVSENQVVKEGDVLLTLDATRAQTNYMSTLNEYVAAAAKLARLTAEQTFADRVSYPEELLAFAEEAGRQDLIKGQDQLFRVRRQAFVGELSILNENLAASQGQVDGMRQQLEARIHQAALLGEEIGELTPLVAAGYAARNRLLEQQRQQAELTSVASDLRSRIAREISNGAEIRLRILQRRQEFLREVEALVSDAQRESANLREKLKDARYELDHTTIVAPVSGQVVALQVGTPGGIITPGAHILEIVPQGDRLLLDIQVPPHLIERVQPGLATDIRVSAFSDEPYLTIEGRVVSLSTDSHDPGNGQPPYYLARVAVTDKGLQDLAGRQLRPGMAVDAVIKTGERSFLAYLMRPITKRLFVSLQER
ncbi:MAG: HlyD family type I secretion periplasmic adaptor subunit [Rhodocyclales bacterium]|nr:HlyD family type I secretion periplasmic adaptor subunit [Rhodocyclales bacterium]